jgi:hypothetical protein
MVNAEFSVPLRSALAQDVRRRHRAVGQIRFHGFIVLLEAGVDQLRAVLADGVENGAVAGHGDLELVRDVGRDIENLPHRILVVRVPDQGLHLDQIDHALEVIFGTDRKLHRQAGARSGAS